MKDIALPRVVTGEKNSATAAHAGHKGRLKWVPGARGCKWATLPRRLLIWWTGPLGRASGDRRTICHCKKVWKPKLWPRFGQTEWNRPRQRKNINEVRIET
jgi:hypothetical protein